MKCLMRYQWVKLARNRLPQGKGIMGAWTKLSSRAAFRMGNTSYCGHINAVSPGTWAGGVVGLKRILGVKSRAEALKTLDILSQLGYVEYVLDSKSKKLTYKINDWVVECSGAGCDNGAVYTTQGYGFLCLPRNITQRLADRGYTFDDADAWLDLWCHTVYQDPRNAFTHLAPAVQFGKYGSALTLENLGRRWGWEKTKVWRFLQKHGDAFTLHKLPGSFGCLIFNTQYPTGTEFTRPSQEEITRILTEIRIWGENTHIAGSDNYRLNRMIAWYSKSVYASEENAQQAEASDCRVADLTPIIRVYLSQCWNCKNCYKDCWRKYVFHPANNREIRGPCLEYGPRFLSTEGGSP